MFRGLLEQARRPRKASRIDEALAVTLDWTMRARVGFGLSTREAFAFRRHSAAGATAAPRFVLDTDTS